MASKKSYNRYFIIFQEEDKGFGTAIDKQPTGYTKIETRNGKAKVTVYAQNLVKEKGPYSCCLIDATKNPAVVARLGEIKVDDTGRGETWWEYKEDDIAGTGSPVDRFNVAAVTTKDNETVAPLAGSIGKERAAWKDKMPAASKPAAKAEEPSKENKAEEKKTAAVEELSEEAKKFKDYEEKIKEEGKDSGEKPSQVKSPDSIVEGEDKVIKAEDGDLQDGTKAPYRGPVVKDDAGNNAAGDNNAVKSEDNNKAPYKGPIVKGENKEDNKADNNSAKAEDNNKVPFKGQIIKDEKKDDNKDNKDNKGQEPAKASKPAGPVVKGEGAKDNAKGNEAKAEEAKKGPFKGQIIKDEKKDENKDSGKAEAKKEDDKKKNFAPIVVNSEDNKEEQKAETYYTKDNYEESEDYSRSGYKKDGRYARTFHEILGRFEEVPNISDELKGYKWWKIPHAYDMPFKENRLYPYYCAIYHLKMAYPYINYIKCFKDTGHYYFGIKYDSIGEVKYIVYGIEGKNRIQEQPYMGMTGFVKWVPLKDKDTGMWLMYYNPYSGCIMIPKRRG